MFSGIVETQAEILKFASRKTGGGDVYELSLRRPLSFDDVGLGDSIAVNGICLTVERLTPEEIVFAVAPETLRVTHWTDANPLKGPVNLERSLKYGDRLHGHLVTGHVDALATVIAANPSGESLDLEVEVPENLALFIWRKGSVALNGVSLTLNDVDRRRARLCLIPETLKRTNLSRLKPGMYVNLEVDNWARGLVRIREEGFADANPANKPDEGFAGANPANT